MIRSVFMAVAVTLLIASISTIALGAPVLSWIGPSKCMSGTVESQHFELDGTNIVGPSTNGYTFQNDVKLYLSVNGGAWQQSNAPITGWNSSKLNLNLNSPVYCPSPGNLRLQITVLGAYSNIMTLTIVPPPSGPPTITSVSPSSFPINSSTWLFRILGTGFDYDSSMVYVNGVSTGFLAFATPVDGVIDVFVPAGLRSTPGVDSVVVKTKYGTSNALNLDIIGPPVISSISPALISFVPPSPSLTARTTSVALPPSSTTSSTTTSASNTASTSAVSHSTTAATHANTTALAPALLGWQFMIRAKDIDNGVTATFGGMPLKINRLVLTPGNQQVWAQLPDWAVDQCAHQSYAIQLATKVGTSNQATLETQGAPCKTPPSPGSLHHIPPS
jgi:hypothetical protein